MKKVSMDKFGINILTIDPLFDEKKVRDFLSTLGGKEIEHIYYEEVTEQPKMFDLKFIGLLIIIIVITSGATYFTLNRLLFMQPFSWMWDQPRVVTQSTSTYFPDGYSMRMPVEGTVARGYIPYEYKGMPDSLIKYLSNPLPVTPEVIEKGRERFNTFCSPCHGYYGKGDSRLHGFFPNPPSLHTDKIRNWPDGNIYNVITNGQNNIMPSYEKSISRDDRWAIIHYIRVLQRSQNAKDSDLEGSNK
jgi:mono/diheme cytochrome c family protein